MVRRHLVTAQNWCLLQGSASNTSLMATAASNQPQLHPAFRRTGTVAACTLASPLPSWTTVASFVRQLDEQDSLASFCCKTCLQQCWSADQVWAPGHHAANSWQHAPHQVLAGRLVCWSAHASNHADWQRSCWGKAVTMHDQHWVKNSYKCRRFQPQSVCCSCSRRCISGQHNGSLCFGTCFEWLRKLPGKTAQQLCCHWHCNCLMPLVMELRPQRKEEEETTVLADRLSSTTPVASATVLCQHWTCRACRTHHSRVSCSASCATRPSAYSATNRPGS